MLARADPEVFAETLLGDRFIPAFFSSRALTLQMVFRSNGRFPGVRRTF